MREDKSKQRGRKEREGGQLNHFLVGLLLLRKQAVALLAGGLQLLLQRLRRQGRRWL